MRFIPNLLIRGKFNLKYILIVIALVIITGAIILICGNKLIPGEFSAPFPEIKKITNNKQNPTENIKPLYYYSQSTDPDIFRVIRIDQDITGEDKVTAELEGRFSVIGKFSEEGKFLVVDDNNSNKLYTLNPESGELKEFFVAEEKKEFESAIFSPDKKFLAFSLVSGDYAKATGEIWLSDLENREREKIFEKKRLTLYTKLKVLGWNNGNGKLIVQEIGGDALAVWGKIYLVDTTNGQASKGDNINNYKEVEIKASEADSFLRGSLSPDGKKWLYISCKIPTPEEYDYTSCEDGAEILIYSFEETSSFSLYRNLTNNNNPFRKKLRNINSAVWLDSENILFSIPDGIYKINLNSKETEELYKFQWTDPDDIFKSPSAIKYVADDIIIYERQNFNAGTFVLNLKTKKTAEIEKEELPIDGFLQ